MTIESFEYRDARRGLTLERTQFGRFNLLVGLSGAGKTSIVRALHNVRAAGLSLWSDARQSEWRIALRFEDQMYIWAAGIAPVRSRAPGDRDPQPDDTIRFDYERIETGDGTLIVERSGKDFLFENNKLPKIKDTESAISLLEAEKSIAPLYRALQRVLFSDAGDRRGMILVDDRALDNTDAQTSSKLADLRDDIDVPILLKAYLANKNHREAFDCISGYYKEIFPNVTDVTVGRMIELDASWDRELDPQLLRSMLTLAIKERGVEQWIVSPYISSGMLRTFVHLAELELSPRGTTIVVDEFENSMGINCLPAVTEQFLARRQDLQFILTSHHPYVINNVPIEWWRPVMRSGSTIRVKSARDIPELNTNPRQDAFTLLTNSSVYEDGIQ